MAHHRHDEREGVVVDFGAGTGAYALPLATLLPGVSILALDEPPEMLDLLRAKLATEPHPNVRTVTPSELPAFAGTIDRVLAINVLHEIGDRDLAAISPLLARRTRALRRLER